MASNPKRGATVEAETDLEILALSRTHVDAVVPQFPGVEKKILKALLAKAASAAKLVRQDSSQASSPAEQPAEAGRLTPQPSVARQPSLSRKPSRK